MVRARLRVAVDRPRKAVVGGMLVGARARCGRGGRVLVGIDEPDVRVERVVIAVEHRQRDADPEHEEHCPDREPRKRTLAAGRRAHPKDGRGRAASHPPVLDGRRGATLSRMDDLRERLRELPCGARLLDAAAGMPGVHLVGGAVRDLLLGRTPSELDVVVEGDIAPLAARLGAGGEDAVAHERFATATVRVGECRWDLASARAETYARPGALPDVRAAATLQRGPPAPRRDDQRAGARSRRRDAARRPARRGGPRGAPPARPARRELHRRPDAAVARRALRGAAGLRDRAAHGRACRPGRRRRRAGDGVRPADRQRAAPRARRARPGGGARCRRRDRRRAVARPRPRAHRARDRAAGARRGAARPARAGRRAAGAPPTTRCSRGWSSPPPSARSCARARAAPALGEEDPPARGPPRSSPAPCATCPSRRSRWPARAARRRPRAAGWTSCAMSRCRSPAPTCWRPASREGPDLGRRLQAVLDRRLDGALAPGREAELQAALQAAPGAGTS